MYYLSSNKTKTALPMFQYELKGFTDFYELVEVISVPLIGTYYIRIDSDSYKDVSDFLKIANNFNYLVIYVMVDDALLKFLKLKKPGVVLLESKSNYEIFEELVSKYKILFKRGCALAMYNAIPHTYEDMSSCLLELKTVYPDVVELGEEHIGKLFPIDTNVYPRTVLLNFLKLGKGRWVQLNKSVETFGNDIVYYAMRKNIQKILDNKIKYLKSGEGDFYSKLLPEANIVKMAYTLIYSNSGLKDVRTLMRLYEKGENVNDIICKTTFTNFNAEYDDA